MLETNLIKVLKGLLKTRNQTQLAYELQISKSLLSEMLNGKKAVSKETAEKLGYREIKVYVKDSELDAYAQE